MRRRVTVRGSWISSRSLPVGARPAFTLMLAVFAAGRLDLAVVYAWID